MSKLFGKRNENMYFIIKSNCLIVALSNHQQTIATTNRNNEDDKNIPLDLYWDCGSEWSDISKPWLCV